MSRDGGALVVAIFLIASSALASCATQPVALIPDVVTVSTPITPEDESRQADVGSVFVERQVVSMLPAIGIPKAIRLDTRDNIVIPAQHAVAYWDMRNWRRHTVSIEVLPAAGEVGESVTRAIALDLNRMENRGAIPEVKLLGSWIETRAAGAVPRQFHHSFAEMPKEWSISQAQSKLAANFRQTLTYLGHSESTIRVLYQEYSDDLLRDRFSLEVKYDLSEGPVFGFRGCRIEVLEADNRKLTYRVIEPFPSDEALGLMEQEVSSGRDGASGGD